MTADINPDRPAPPGSGLSHATAVHPPAPTSARAQLNGRVLVAAGSLEQHRYPEILRAESAVPEMTGLVVCGSDSAATVRRIRSSHPKLFLLCDPAESDRFTASAVDPFPQSHGDENTLFGPSTLEERVQAQIEAGASVAMTPTGHVQAGDRLALRAVIVAGNELKRDDVVVLLPLASKWLVGDALKAVVAAVKRCRHPVAITLCDSSTDPMSHKGVLHGAHTLAELDEPPMFHKTDLAGFDLMAHGALAASVGVIASKRRGAIPDKSAYAPRTNKGANVLVPDLLRFRRSLDMQDQWFASRKAPDCDCSVCAGRPIDRFSSADYDSVAAAQHNAIALVRIVNAAAETGGYDAHWPDAVRDAIVAHSTLSQYIGTQIDPPRELLAWNHGFPGGLASR